MAKFTCDIVTPEAKCYTGRSPLRRGARHRRRDGLLSGHVPLVSTLSDGSVRVQEVEGARSKSSPSKVATCRSAARRSSSWRQGRTALSIARPYVRGGPSGPPLCICGRIVQKRLYRAGDSSLQVWKRRRACALEEHGAKSRRMMAQDDGRGLRGVRHACGCGCGARSRLGSLAARGLAAKARGASSAGIWRVFDAGGESAAFWRVLAFHRGIFIQLAAHAGRMRPYGGCSPMLLVRYAQESTYENQEQKPLRRAYPSLSRSR